MRYLILHALFTLLLLGSIATQPLPTSWRTHLQEARILAAKKDTSAFEKFRAAMQIVPDSAEPYYYRGLFHYQLGNRAKALRDFGHAISRSPEEPRYYYLRGVIGMEVRDFEGAADQFSAALMLDTTNSFLYICRAQAQAGIGNIPTAIADMTTAIRHDSVNPEAFFERAMLYVKVRAISKALTDLNIALRLDDNYDTALVERGKLHLAANMDKACQDFIQAARLGSLPALELLRQNCTAASKRMIDSLRVFVMPTASVVANADEKERAKHEIIRASREGLRSVRYWASIGSSNNSWRRSAGLQQSSPFGQVLYGVTMNGTAVDCGSGTSSTSAIDLSCVIQDLRNQAYILNDPLLQTLAATLQQKYLDYRQSVLAMSTNAQYAGSGFGGMNSGLPQDAVVLLNDIEIGIGQIQQRISQIQQKQ
jgi:lipoprotein NlpI